MQNQLPPNTPLSLRDNRGVDRSKVYAIFLCKAKATNIYTEEAGINADRLKYFFKTHSRLTCDRPIVEDCVATYKDVAHGGELIYKVIECISKREEEELKKGC